MSTSDLVRYCRLACNSSYIAYSQTYRTTGSTNFDGSGWSQNSYFDCSSLMSWCIYKAGYVTSNPNWDTDGIYNQLGNNSAFEMYQLKSGGSWRVSDSFTLKAGDIIVTVTHPNRWASGVTNYGGHTYMVLEDGTLSGGALCGEAFGQNNVAWANQVATYTRSKSGSYPISSRGYCRLFRLNGTESSEPATSNYVWTQKGNYSGTVVNSNYNLTSEQKLANAHKVYEKLSALGWSDCAIAGVLGNIANEGTLNPDCWNYSTTKNACGMTHTDGGYGICQWTPATKYTNSSYCPSDYKTNATANGNGQVEFLDSNSSQWRVVNGYTYADFKANNESPEKSAKDFACYFEGYCASYDDWVARYGSTSWNARQTSAREWYTKITTESWASNAGGQSYNTTSAINLWLIQHHKRKW